MWTSHCGKSSFLITIYDLYFWYLSTMFVLQSWVINQWITIVHFFHLGRVISRFIISFYSEFLPCKHPHVGFKPGTFGTNCVWTLLTPKPTQPPRLDMHNNFRFSSLWFERVEFTPFNKNGCSCQKCPFISSFIDIYLIHRHLVHTKKFKR